MGDRKELVRRIDIVIEGISRDVFATGDLVGLLRELRAEIYVPPVGPPVCGCGATGPGVVWAERRNNNVMWSQDRCNSPNCVPY